VLIRFICVIRVLFWLRLCRVRNLGSNNHWIKIKCIGSALKERSYSNTSAIGTKVRIKATINGNPVWQMREISGLTGYMGQNSMIAEFGLGDATSVETIIVQWPSGIVQVLKDQPVNQFITITEDYTTT